MFIYKPHLSLSLPLLSVSPSPWSPHQGAGTTTYSPGAPTNTSYGSPTSSSGGGTGNNYDDVRAELRAMMDNPSWDDGVSAVLLAVLSVHFNMI